MKTRIAFTLLAFALLFPALWIPDPCLIGPCTHGHCIPVTGLPCKPPNTTPKHVREVSITYAPTRLYSAISAVLHKG